MHARQSALNDWLKTLFTDNTFTWKPLAGDASFRQYFRLHHGNESYIVMDAPPNKETISPFITMNQLLAKGGIHTPAIHALEQEQGFILLEDLGDELLLSALANAPADNLYKAAIATLIQIQQCPTLEPQLPAFDKAHMMQELTLFRQWFLHDYLALQLGADEEQLIQNTFDWIIKELERQPQVFIHRDYHSRNLLIVGQNTPPDIGVIDFQDAMRGPFAYDLVSLLKDCYIQWPREQITNWLEYFYSNLPNNFGYTLSEFVHAFDVCGLQRHLKVLGIFCRLHLRDKKDAYLRDLPLTFNYVMACLESYRELQPFYHFMQHKVQPLFIETLHA